MVVQKNHALNEQIEDLAIKTLTFLASDPERLGKFCSTTGIGPGTLRQSAKSPDFFISILQYLTQDEALLLQFCEASNTPPKQLSLFQDYMQNS